MMWMENWFANKVTEFWKTLDNFSRTFFVKIHEYISVIYQFLEQIQ